MTQILSFLLTVIVVFSGELFGQPVNKRNYLYEWKTDTSKHSVTLSEFSVVLARNSFPSINYPQFIGNEKALEFFLRNEPVIAVEINGRSKAYPLNMLTLHEISNDTLAGIPILPTYCPLCNSSMVFDRRLQHKEKDYVLEFEVSGMLRNSDMVLADQKTESWWQQLTGEALVGELKGAQLTILPSQVISLEAFLMRYPNGKVLSPQSGTKTASRYGTNPYPGYDKQTQNPIGPRYDPELFTGHLPAMERVISLHDESLQKAYPFSAVAFAGVVNDTFGADKIALFYSQNTISVLDEKRILESRQVGSVTVFSRELNGQLLTFRKKKGVITDKETKSTWDITGLCISGQLKGQSLTPVVHGNHFAFAWFGFFPDSQVFGH